MTKEDSAVVSMLTSTQGKENAKKSSSRGGRDRSGNDHGQSRGSRRPPSSGEKVVVRRLPPGMTEAEFTSILGAEWAVGKGSVDWFSYAPGKVSSEYGSLTPSMPWIVC
jgi:regulator of nonsense transcripts 3